jgi:hypothetical protein
MGNKLDDVAKYVSQPRTAGDRIAQAAVGGIVILGGLALSRAIAPTVEEAMDPNSNLADVGARTYIGAGIQVTATLAGIAVIAGSLGPDYEIEEVPSRRSTKKRSA